MKKIIGYFKKNKYYLAVMTCCALAFMALMHQAVLYADDYSVGAVALGGFPEIAKSFSAHYMGWGGGYTPTIVELLLMCHPVVWKIVVVLLVSGIISMASRIISRDNSNKRSIAALVMWVLFFCTSVLLLRETIIWLDGSMAYLFTTFQAFLVFYMFYTRLFQNDSRKYDVLLVPIACFFGGWSSAQSGCIVVAMIVAMLLYRKLVNKNKMPLLFWISSVLALIGFCIFYFAPGNYVRLDTFEYYNSLSFVNKMLFRISGIYELFFDGHHYEATASSLFIQIAFGAVALYAYSKAKDLRNKKTKKLSTLCSLIVGLFVAGYMVSLLPIKQVEDFALGAYHYSNILAIERFSLKFFLAFIPYLWATLACAATVINAWVLSKKIDKNPFLITVLLMMLGTNLCMVFAPYSPLRTIFYSVVFAWIMTAYILNSLLNNSTRIVILVAVMIACMDINLAIVLALVYLFAWSVLRVDKQKLYIVDYVALFVCLGLYAAGNYATVFYNYRLNRLINNDNIARILEFKDGANDCDEGETAQNCTIYLVRPQNEKYANSLLVGEEWIEESVKGYFKLPNNVVLKWEGE